MIKITPQGCRFPGGIGVYSPTVESFLLDLSRASGMFIVADALDYGRVITFAYWPDGQNGELRQGARFEIFILPRLLGSVDAVAYVLRDRWKMCRQVETARGETLAGRELEITVSDIDQAEESL